MFESVRFGRLDLERQRTLDSVGSAALCDVGAALERRLIHTALLSCAESNA